MGTMSRRLTAVLVALWSAGPGISSATAGEDKDDRSLPRQGPESASPEVGRALEWLRKESRDLVRGARVMAADGTPMYTPDGKGNYRALWTRDFAYMVSGAGDVLPEKDVEACLRCLVRAVRADGAAPDRVRPDGVPVYVAGPENGSLGEPNIDNAQFLVLAVDAFLGRLPRDRRKTLFSEWAPALNRAMDYIPRSETGLVYNDPRKPHSPYGFTDLIGKTGELLMESLLYWQACRRLAALHRDLRDEGAGEATPDRERIQDHDKRAALIEKNITHLWHERDGAFVAATLDCRQVDVWGNAYAIFIGFPLGPKEEAVVRFLASRADSFLYRGQVRHLVKGEYWQRLLAPVEKDRYQNGAYWATAAGWMLVALAKARPELARKAFLDLVADFQSGGICECIHPDGYRQLPSYVVSAVNPLAAAEKLWGRGGN